MGSGRRKRERIVWHWGSVFLGPGPLIIAAIARDRAESYVTTGEPVCLALAPAKEDLPCLTDLLFEGVGFVNQRQHILRICCCSHSWACHGTDQGSKGNPVFSAALGVLPERCIASCCRRSDQEVWIKGVGHPRRFISQGTDLEVDRRCAQLTEWSACCSI